MRNKGRFKPSVDKLDSDSSDGRVNSRERRRAKKLELQNRFKLKPEDEADPNAMLGRSRLMIRIHRMEHKKEDVHSEDNMNNSYDESASEISTGEDAEVDEEEKARRAKKRAARKKKKKKKRMMFMMGQQTVKKKPGRKPIMNVYCTDYDVVRKAAKNAGFRLKEYKEDHDGAIVKD